MPRRRSVGMFAVDRFEYVSVACSRAYNRMHSVYREFVDYHPWRNLLTPTRRRRCDCGFLLAEG